MTLYCCYLLNMCICLFACLLICLWFYWWQSVHFGKKKEKEETNFGCAWSLLRLVLLLRLWLLALLLLRLLGLCLLSPLLSKHLFALLLFILEPL